VTPLVRTRKDATYDGSDCDARAKKGTHTKSTVQITTAAPRDPHTQNHSSSEGSNYDACTKLADESPALS
jgi:hypothetical protein